jgi:spore coat polysaccharide biosynthesis predicted glycosyltransferase SpsG
MIQEPAALLRAEIQKHCTTVQELKASADFIAEAEYISENLKENEIIVLDGYHFNTAYQSTMRRKGNKVVVIDDVNTDYFVADVVINHVAGIQDADIKCETYTQKKTGTDYAVLRKEFLLAAADSVPRPLDQFVFFISMGGADRFNATLKNLQLLLTKYPDAVYHVLIGQAYRHTDTLKELKGNIQIYTGLDAAAMVAVMKKCNIAICPASTVSYEAMCLNLPVVTGYISEMQISIADKLDSFGLVVNTGDLNNPGVKLLQAIEKIRTDAPVVTGTQKKYFYGQQLSNLLSVFNGLAA